MEVLLEISTSSSNGIKIYIHMCVCVVLKECLLICAKSFFVFSFSCSYHICSYGMKVTDQLCYLDPYGHV